MASACVATMVGGLAAGGVALAQATAGGSADSSTARPTDVGEVIVTATRRSERLQDVPLSVTAYSQETLTAKGIVGYEGLAQETPGVVLNRASANFNNFTARGIATNGYGANLQSTVAVYIDELPISTIGNTTVLDPNLFDVERVEFLRGPQGTLFGSGSLSGALRILTRKPDPSGFEAKVLADVGLTGSDSVRLLPQRGRPYRQPGDRKERLQFA
jgi:outer membrane receptor protein involved in Fe transport